MYPANGGSIFLLNVINANHTAWQCNVLGGYEQMNKGFNGDEC
jgi:hypothetical protein